MSKDPSLLSVADVTALRAQALQLIRDGNFRGLCDLLVILTREKHHQTYRLADEILEYVAKLVPVVVGRLDLLQLTPLATLLAGSMYSEQYDMARRQIGFIISNIPLQSHMPFFNIGPRHRDHDLVDLI